jgi:hypothetical protein
MNAATKIVGQLLVAGGEIDVDALKAKGYEIHTHWSKMPLDKPSIPSSVDMVVLVSDDVNLLLTQYVRNLCEKELIPLAYVKKDLCDFDACIQKALDVVEVQQELESMVDASNNDEENTMEAKTDGRSQGANVQRAHAKMELVREYLKKDPRTPTETIQAAIVSQFGKGLTPSTITKVRVEEFGTKIGPRGKIEGEATPVVARSKSAPRRATVDNKESLESVLTKLRQVMEATGTEKIEVDSAGHAKIFGGTRELTLRA